MISVTSWYHVLVSDSYLQQTGSLHTLGSFGSRRATLIPSSAKYPFAWARKSGAWYGVACLATVSKLFSLPLLLSLYQLVKKVILSVDMLADQAGCLYGLATPRTSSARKGKNKRGGIQEACPSAGIIQIKFC